MSKILIAGGSGLVGRRLTQLLKQDGHEVSWLSRHSPSKSPVAVSTWNPDKEYLPEESLKGVDTIISLAGTSVSDKSWSPEYKQDIIGSRLSAARTILKALNSYSHTVSTVIAASAVGIYGDRGEEWLTEESSAGTGFLSETCLQWEDAYRNCPVRTVTIRIGIVLSKEGGALREMAAPLMGGVCPILGTGKQYMSWIHLDDLCRMMIFALKQQSMQGIYNATAPSPVMHREFMHTLRRIKQPVSIPVPVPVGLMKMILGEKSAIVLDSTRVSSKKITDAGFSFQYTGLSDCLKNIYGK
jgi:uncharacterized protein